MIYRSPRVTVATGRRDNLDPLHRAPLCLHQICFLRCVTCLLPSESGAPMRHLSTSDLLGAQDDSFSRLALSKHDVKFSGQYRWIIIGDLVKSYYQPITRSGIAHTHQYGIGSVPRFTRHIHLGDEPLEPTT